MNKRAVNAGLLYCIVAIIFKLTVLLGGYATSKFGFYYAQVVSIFLIIPFFFMAIYRAREKDKGGFIGGREALRIALTVLVVGIIIMSAYNYIEFSWKGKDLATSYYNSSEYLEILKDQQSKHPDKIKAGDFPRIIQEQVAASSVSAFRSTTAKLFPLIIIGLSSAFIAAALMKKSPR